MCERERENVCVCIKYLVAGSIPDSDKILFFTEKMLVVANVEILLCVSRGVPGNIREPQIYILLIVRLNRWTTESYRCSWVLRLKLEG